MTTLEDKMRLIVMLLLCMGALGCRPPVTPPDADPSLNSGGSERLLATDRESYAAGGEGVLTLRNPFRHTLGYNLCPSTLERQQSGAWRAAEYGNDRICTMELRTLPPGGTATYPFRLDGRLPAGEYRFRTSVENMGTGQMEPAISNTFRVTR